MNELWLSHESRTAVSMPVESTCDVCPDKVRACHRRADCFFGETTLGVGKTEVTVSLMG
jgi:hypothetical protein